MKSEARGSSDSSTPKQDQELLRVYTQYVSEADRAFAALMERHGAMVYRTCLRIVGDPATAEDAAQAVFLVLARRAGSVHGEVGAFLHGVAVNIARKALASGRVRSQHEREAGKMREALADSAVGEASSGEAMVDTWAEMAPYLDESLEQLPVRQREALVLHYLEGRSHADVAERMGLARRTVEKHVQLGLEKLRRRMARRGGVSASVSLLTRQMSGFSGEGSCPGFLAGQAKNLSAAGLGSNTAGLAPQVVQWGEGAIQMMYWAKVKTVASIAAACMVLTLGVAAAMDLGPAGDGPAPPVVAPGEKPVEGPKPPPTGEAGLKTPPKSIEVNGLKFEPVVTPAVWLLRDSAESKGMQPACRVTNTTASDLYLNRQHFEFELVDGSGRTLKPILIPDTYAGPKQPEKRPVQADDFVLIKAGESKLIEWLHRLSVRQMVDGKPVMLSPSLAPPSAVRGLDSYFFALAELGQHQLKVRYQNENDKTIVDDPKTGKPLEITTWTGKADIPAVAVEFRRGEERSEFITKDNRILLDQVGTSGYLVIRSPERMKQWGELLKPHRLWPEHVGGDWKQRVDFSKEMVLFVYRAPNAGDQLTINSLHKDAAGWRVFLGLEVDEGLGKQSNSWQSIAILLPAAPAVTVHAEYRSDTAAGQPEKISKQWQIDAHGGDIVNGLQGVLKLKEGERKPGDDIELTFELRKVDLKQKEAIWVWDNKLAYGHRNDAYLVTKPDGSTVLLRELESERNWMESREVSIGNKPWTLGDARGNPIVKSLKRLGLDTTAPGVYTIVGLYMPEAGPGRMEVSKGVKVKMWGGNIATPPITVTIAKPE